jgi:STAS-like domain of unknown function (DUF4325)
MLSIANDFSKFPAGRYKEDGPFNGTRFRDEILVPKLTDALQSGSRLVVILDGVVGYSSSFLEEVFGGLARVAPFPLDRITSTLVIRADDVAYQPAKIDAENYLREALRSSIRR